MFYLGHKGAEISSGEDEQWEYFSDGLTKNLKDNYEYKWDGEFFQPTSTDFNYGTGKWDGLNLWWFPPMGNSFLSVKNRVGDTYFRKNPLFHYLFVPVDVEFYSGIAGKDWKFSRHFLVSRSGNHPEWKIEGEVPKPVVMCLELLRSARTEKTTRKSAPRDPPAQSQPKDRSVSIGSLLSEMELHSPE